MLFVVALTDTHVIPQSFNTVAPFIMIIFYFFNCLNFLNLVLLFIGNKGMALRRQGFFVLNQTLRVM
jgi:hypothetical protein